MNNLSWLLYWADAAPSIAGFVSVVAFFAFTASLVFLLLGFTGFFGEEATYNSTKEISRYHDNKAWVAELAPRFRNLWPLTVLAFVLSGGSFFVPSKETFYLIAASEAGEQAVQTPEFVKVRAVLNKWLNDQVTPQKETTQ